MRAPYTSPQAGFQLIEMLIVIAIIAIVGLIAVPSFSSYMDEADRITAETDIGDIAQSIEQYYVGNDEYPDSLADIDKDGMRDPWGNAYGYLKIFGTPPSDRGSMRKDKNLVPLNSDFDLYSTGKDGQSQPPLSPPVSHDDIIRASDGRFLGYAADF